MFAITYDLKTNILKKNKLLSKAYKIISDCMLKNGFVWKQGSAYSFREQQPRQTSIEYIAEAAKSLEKVMQFIRENKKISPAVRDIRVLSYHSWSDFKSSVK